MRKPSSSPKESGFQRLKGWVTPIALLVAAGLTADKVRTLVQKPNAPQVGERDHHRDVPLSLEKKPKGIDPRIESLPDELLGATVEKTLVPGATKVIVHLKTAHLSPNPDAYERTMMQRIEDDLLAVSGAILTHFGINAIAPESTNEESIIILRRLKEIKKQILDQRHLDYFEIGNQKQLVEKLAAMFGPESDICLLAKKELKERQEIALLAQKSEKIGDEHAQFDFPDKLNIDNNVEILATSLETGVNIQKLLSEGVPMSEIEKLVYDGREDEAVKFATADKERYVVILAFGANHDFSNNLPPNTSLIVVTPSTVRSFFEASKGKQKQPDKTPAKDMHIRPFRQDEIERPRMRRDDGFEDFPSDPGLPNA